MKKILLQLIAILLFSYCANAQDSYTTLNYSAMEKKLSVWKDNLNPEPLPKKAKFKRITYKGHNYVIEGYFKDGMLLNGQKIIIYEIGNKEKVLLEGIVFNHIDEIKVKGIRYEYSNAKIAEVYGVFSISNSVDNSIIIKPKKAGPIVIKDTDKIEYYKGSCFNCNALISISENPYFFLDGRSGLQDFDYLSAPLSLNCLSEIGYNNPYELFKTINNNVLVSSGDNHFIGSISHIFEEEKGLKFNYLCGRKIGNKDIYRQTETYEESGALCVDILPDNKETKLECITLIISNGQSVPKNSYWDIEYFCKNCDLINLTYKNGEIHKGKGTCEFISLPLANFTIKTTLTEGEIIYSNGDSFKGKLNGDTFYGIHTQGITKFKDGTEKRGNWLNEYNLSAKQLSKLAGCKCPSVIRDSANVFKKNNLYDNYIKRAKENLLKKKYSSAKQYYLKAKEIKPYSQECVDGLKKVEGLIKKEERRKKLLSKYGEHNGNLIAEGYLKIGMTKEMVIDAINDKIIVDSYSIRTHSYKRVFNTINEEIWEFDPSNAVKLMNSEVYNETGEDLSALIVLGTLFGINIESEISKFVKYKYIKFENNKIIELRTW